jgi:ribosome-binding protein aMBF1 (putative translation factor)
MRPAVIESSISEICERLSEVINAPESFGLCENPPPRLLAILMRTREILIEQMDNATEIPVADDRLAAELSQDTDTRYYFVEEEKTMKAFNRLLSRRMEQLHLSTNDVAVSLHTTIKDVWDLRRGVMLPTEQRIAELALLLGMTRENLRTAVQEQVNGHNAGEATKCLAL